MVRKKKISEGVCWKKTVGEGYTKLLKMFKSQKTEENIPICTYVHQKLATSGYSVYTHIYLRTYIRMSMHVYIRC